MKKTALIIAVSMGLVACGSGSSGTVVDKPKPTRPVSSKQDNVKQDNVKQDNVKQDNVKQDNVKQDDVKQDNVKQDNVKQDNVKQDNVKQDNVKQDNVKQDDVKQDDVKQDDVKQDNVKQDDVKQDNKPKEKVYIDLVGASGKYPLNYREDLSYRPSVSPCSDNNGFPPCYADNSNELDSVKLNGIEIVLLPSNQSNNFYYTTVGKKDDGKQDNEAIIGGVKYKYSRFALTDPNLFGWQAISQGVVTKDMPTSDTITYNGDAIGFKADVTDKMTTGKTTVYVDFGDKSLYGYFHKWSDSKMPESKFSANIKGNEFINAKGIVVKGKFYGKNAAEMGGIVNSYDPNHQHSVIVFGAERQQ